MASSARIASRVCVGEHACDWTMKLWGADQGPGLGSAEEEKSLIVRIAVVNRGHGASRAMGSDDTADRTAKDCARAKVSAYRRQRLLQ